MKSYTDIEQSKILAEFLPIKSADMCYDGYALDNNGSHPIRLHKPDGEYDIPCWSLAALFSVLPSGYVIVKNYQGLYYVESRDHERSTNIFNNSTDACYEMVLKLHELKIL